MKGRDWNIDGGNVGEEETFQRDRDQNPQGREKESDPRRPCRLGS